MQAGEKIAALLAVKEFPAEDDQQFVVMGTRKGVIKKTDLKSFSNPRADGIIAMGVDEADSVIAVELSSGSDQVFLGTRDGMAIRFDESGVRSMGRTAYGVRGISLRDDDEVVGDGDRAGRRHAPHRRAERLRQADRPRRVPASVTRRIRHDQHPGVRSERQGRRDRLRHRRRRGDADQPAGDDPEDPARETSDQSAGPPRACA